MTATKAEPSMTRDVVLPLLAICLLLAGAGSYVMKGLNESAWTIATDKALTFKDVCDAAGAKAPAGLCEKATRLATYGIETTRDFSRSEVAQLCDLARSSIRTPAIERACGRD